jgi:hypothetical protein
VLRVPLHDRIVAGDQLALPDRASAAELREARHGDDLLRLGNLLCGELSSGSYWGTWISATGSSSSARPSATKFANPTRRYARGGTS